MFISKNNKNKIISYLEIFSNRLDLNTYKKIYTVLKILGFRETTAILF